MILSVGPGRGGIVPAGQHRLPPAPNCSMSITASRGAGTGLLLAAGLSSVRGIVAGGSLLCRCIASEPPLQSFVLLGTAKHDPRRGGWGGSDAVGSKSPTSEEAEQSVDLALREAGFFVHRVGKPGRGSAVSHRLARCLGLRYVNVTVWNQRGFILPIMDSAVGWQRSAESMAGPGQRCGNT